MSDFLNFTDIPDDKARELVGKLSQLVERGEQDVEWERQRANDAISIWKNKFWDEEDIKYFEEKFNVAPYQINVARSPISKLVNQQRQSRYDFYVTPEDEASFDRHRRGREQFVAEHAEEFDTVEQARDHYDRYYDDEYARAVSIHYAKIRNRTKTKYVESDAFENAMITGVDFLKTTFTKKNNPNGEILTERRSIRQMIWDHTSVSPFLDDIEYIGEIHRLYKNDLVQLFPHKKAEIEKHFDNYTNYKNGADRSALSRNWIDLYDFENAGMGVRAKVAELWFKEPEERFQVVDKKSDIPRLVRYGVEEEAIWDLLYEIELDQQVNAVEKGELAPEFFQRDKADIKEDIKNIVEDKYELRTTQVNTWFKAFFTKDGLLELLRNPLPTESHPYTPVFAQFTEGWFTGIIDDIKDMLLAYNKAVMFREIMLANSPKGLLFIDKGTVNKSGYTTQQIAEMWTEVGGVIDLDLKGGRRLSDVFQQVNTIGDGLREITSVIDELEAKIYRTIGVNDAMLGIVGNEASAAQVRQRIQQGTGVNGLIFDNFSKALETHAHEKVIPLVVADLMAKQPKAIKDLSDNRERWIELAYNQEFDLFVDAIMNGEFQTKLVTKEADKQIELQQGAMLMELSAMRPDVFSPEAAIEFSSLPFRGEFLRRNRELMRQQQRDTQLRQIDISRIAEIMAESGVDEDTAEMMLKKMRATAVKEQEAKQNPNGQGMQTIRGLSAENTRQSRIESQNFAQNT